MHLPPLDFVLAQMLLEYMRKELSMTETNATTIDTLLPVVFGKTSNGEIVTRDLARLPHLYSPIVHEPEQGVSTSWLQRQLNIGYNDAAHVMSLLEERGIIGSANDKGPREILIEDI